ncbi:MAG: hypothetical protein IMW89_00485 [Ktedonobacteraceae bacterium]|nr:hypothetical protein [Ktedonobacteraceae bacterium]
MLAEKLTVFDADSPLWHPLRPLLDVVLQFDQHNEQHEQWRWHGWTKKQIEAFLASLPAHCTLIAGVWETGGVPCNEQKGREEHETLVLSCICEVANGTVRSLRTFASLQSSDVPPLSALEPGYEHALAIMRAVRVEVAPVAWALFTEKAAWDEWLLSEGENGDKGELLARLARQGRCVLLGSQVQHHHS